MADLERCWRSRQPSAHLSILTSAFDAAPAPNKGSVAASLENVDRSFVSSLNRDCMRTLSTARSPDSPTDEPGEGE